MGENRQKHIHNVACQVMGELGIRAKLFHNRKPDKIGRAVFVHYGIAIRTYLKNMKDDKVGEIAMCGRSNSESGGSSMYKAAGEVPNWITYEDGPGTSGASLVRNIAIAALAAAIADNIRDDLAG